MPDSRPDYPAIVDSQADALFREIVQRHGWDPDGRWFGDYVRYEWDHFRHFALVESDRYCPGARALEFGCNIGATSIVLALLGLEVTATDMDPRFLEIAQVNARRYRVADRITFRERQVKRPLPDPSATFDLVVCNSVLEYVSPGQLRFELSEIDRVLRPGGMLHVIGTSNRLYPREVHSGRWGVNYLPSWLDSAILGPGRTLQRGIWPWAISKCLPGYSDLDRIDSGHSFLEAKRRCGTGPLKMLLLQVLCLLAPVLRTSAGALSPSIHMRLAKPVVPEY